VGGFSAVAAGLIHLGIPKEEAIEYENAIIADKFLLIANVAPEDLARARQILGISAPSGEHTRQISYVLFSDSVQMEHPGEA
jgi:hypothetical protein